MKQNPVMAWTISAILYLGVVIGGYAIYDVNKEPAAETEKQHESGQH